MCFYTGQFVGLANNTENVIGSVSSLETQMIWEATILAKTVPPPNAVTPCLNISPDLQKTDFYCFTLFTYLAETN